MQTWDTRIKQLQKEYGLYFRDTTIEYKEHWLPEIEKIICQKILDIDKSKKLVWAIRGGGNHTERLLEAFKKCKVNLNIKYIIDHKKTKISSSDNFSYISPIDVQKHDINAIIISSHKYRKEMIDELKKSGFSGIIVNIYDLLEKEGIYLDSPYFFKADGRLNYVDIFFERVRYENEIDQLKKEEYLRRLISRYINIRDFVYARKYLKVYSKSFGNKLDTFSAEIENIISEVKYQLSLKQTNDILLFWVDQLQFKDLKEMAYLSDFAEKNISFENSYTQNLQTSTTFKTMFSGKDLLDDNAYLIDVITKDNSNVYAILQENSYDFKYIGWGKNNVYFDGISTYSLEKDNCIFSLNTWKMIIDLLDNNINTLYLSHSFEAHEHHYCGFVSDILFDITNSNYQQFETRYKECIAYIDKQLSFYLPFFQYNCSVIVMSDHGQELENVYKFDENMNTNCEPFKIGRWSENSLHTVMILKSPFLKPKKVNGLFSLVQFSEIITSVIKKQWLVKEKEYVKIQSMPFYDKEGIRKILKTSDYKYGFLAKGIITQNEKYLLYADGHEEYYLHQEEEKDLSKHSEYKNRIKTLRELCGEVDMSLFKIDKYKDALILMEIADQKSIT